MNGNVNQENGSHPDAAVPPSNDKDKDKEMAINARWGKPLIPANGGEATLLVRIAAPVGIEMTRRAPLDVAFVLDRSGSMQSGKLDLAKDGVSLAVSRLRDADRLALVVYDDTVDIVQPLTAATPRVKASLRLALHGVDPGGSTFLSGGWIAGCQELAEAPTVAGDGPQSRVRRAILLTDGLANVGMVSPQELSQHAGQLRRRGLATTTLGVGQDFDEGLLSAMAEAGGGNFQYAPNPEVLRAFFSQELQELFNVAASGFVVTLTLPAGLQAELISAFPVEARGSALEVALGDIPSGDEIDLVFNVRAGAGSVGDLLAIDVVISWTDPRADARHCLRVDLPALRRADRDVVEATSQDELVAERAALQCAAAERRAGLELDRAGRYAESRARMAQSRAYLMAAPMTASVQADLADSERLAETSVNFAYSSHERKAAQYHEDLRRRGRYSQSSTETAEKR